MRQILIAAAVLAAGCMKTLPPPEPPPHEGAELVVHCPPELNDLVRARSRAWVERQQASVKTAEWKPDAGPQGDVMLIPTPDLPRWAAAGAVAHLPGEFVTDGGRFEWRRLLPDYRERLLKWSGEAYAVPVVGEAPVCVFRSDLYAENESKYRAWQKRRAWDEFRTQKRLSFFPGHALRGPLTWEEFALQAEFFRDLTGRPSLPPLPESEADLDRLFYTVAASYARRAVPADEKGAMDRLDETYSFHFDQRTGGVRIAGPGFVEALALLQRLQGCRPTDTAARPEDAFAQGAAVLCLTDASSLVEFQKRPALRDRFGVCQIPGALRHYAAGRRSAQEKVNRVPYLGAGGWLAVAPAASRQQAAAFDLLEEMAGPAGSRQTALEPRWGGPTRMEHLLRDRWDSYDLDAARTTSLKEALTRTLLQHGITNPVTSLRTPDRLDYRAALVEGGLRPALLKGEAPERALAEVARRWEALIAKRGKEAHLRDYRLSLGLLGR
jgi:ABC-type glycerol-3-phosphate transport system substrate-binding protein